MHLWATWNQVLYSSTLGECWPCRRLLWFSHGDFIGLMCSGSRGKLIGGAWWFKRLVKICSLVYSLVDISNIRFLFSLSQLCLSCILDSLVSVFSDLLCSVQSGNYFLWLVSGKSTGEGQMLTYTSLFLFEDLRQSGVTNRKTVSVVFTVYCRRGHAHLHR